LPAAELAHRPEEKGGAMEHQRRLDGIRRGSTELENHVIDEFFAGHISRREFVRAGTVVGMSVPLLTFLAACAGAPAPSSGGQGTVVVKKGGKITAAVATPAKAVDPFLVSDQGGLVLIDQIGEFMVFSAPDLSLVPRLAESWTPNQDGSVWTFKIRQGVTFNDGSPLTAEDVAATVNMHTDPANKSNAASVFKGVLSKGSAKSTDPTTVQFTLDAPNGNFPYLVSSDNYNLIILPKSYSGGFDKSFVSAGPFKVTSYDTTSGISMVRNPSYWDKSNTPPLDAVDWKFFADEPPRIQALQGGSVALVDQVSASGGQALFNDPNIKIVGSHSAANRQVHMRTDQDPFTDKRVRQAMALALGRPDIVQGVLNGKAQIANDSPFFKLYPSTDQSVQQRQQAMSQAKQLLQAAGKGAGFTVSLSTWRGFEIPDLAQAIQAAVKPLGITINLNITDVDTYYGASVFGQSPWLDSVMGITDYAHRGVPNTYLNAPLKSDGVWNAAHFKSTAYDQLFGQYVAAIDIASQRKVAGQIQQLLLDETPIMFPYNYDFLGATRSNVGNVQITGVGQVNLRQAGLTS
jgi:peptide/nickel transport system substrate-binding protein